jgi:TPR repeat protein
MKKMSITNSRSNSSESGGNLKTSGNIRAPPTFSNLPQTSSPKQQIVAEPGSYDSDSYSSAENSVHASPKPKQKNSPYNQAQPDNFRSNSMEPSTYSQSYSNLNNTSEIRYTRERRMSDTPKPPHSRDSSYANQTQNTTIRESEYSRQSMAHSDSVLTSEPSSIQLRIPTSNALETYRQNAKKSQDPEIQLDFAKYLLETAALVLQNPDNDIDPVTARKMHNSLINEALKWIKRLSSQGIGLGKGAYPEAQFFLANCYNNGSLGLPVDHDKAFNLYVQASKQSHPAATYRTGVCYELGAGTKRDPHRALQFFRKASALGDTAAMFKVGMVLLKGGLSQQPNPREGITWLKRAAAAADAENPHSLHELASCYEKGGIPSIIVDHAYARELYTQAAQLGYAHSQFKMGVCYEQGLLTCPVDPRRSIAWFTKGAEQGDPECELALSGWYLTGSEGVLQQSDSEAYLWARRAADRALSKAEYAVGYYTEVGIGTDQNPEEARRWYMRAAAQGNKRAVQRLQELKSMNTGRSRKDKEDGSCIIS